MPSPLLIWSAPIALVLALIGLGLSLAAFRRSKPPSGDVVSAIRDGDGARALELLAQKTAALEADLARNQLEVGGLSAKQGQAIQHAGIVRFDALNEQTGELSFAIALLDDDQNGVVISSINGRQQTRLYGKAIDAGRPSAQLSDEEREAIARAMRPR
jgi:hypothetical protein